MSSSQDQSDLFEGRRRRDKIIDEHAERRKWLLQMIDGTLTTCAMFVPGQDRVTADTAMGVLDNYYRRNPDAPQYDRRFLGALWRKPHWKKTGQYVQSRRPERHARPIPVWKYSPEDAL